MMDEDKLIKLLELCCDVMNAAADIDINVEKEMDTAMKTILTVADKHIIADFANIRAAFRSNSDTIQ
jgi:hypothetical protein